MLRLLIAAPFLLVVVLFALSNKQYETFRFWPTDYEVALPLSIAMLGAMAVAFVAGAFVVWVSAVAARRRARRAEQRARMLEAQVTELKAKLSPTRAPTTTSGFLVPAGR